MPSTRAAAARRCAVSDTPAVSLTPAPDPAPAVEALRDHPAAGRPSSLAAAVQLPPLLLDMPALSQMLHRSEASLYRDDSAGRLPAGLTIGASKRWRYAEIVAWVEASCPSRREWEARRAAEN